MSLWKFGNKNSESDIQKWANSHREVKLWLEIFDIEMEKNLYAYCLRRFCDHLKMTPQQLVLLWVLPIEEKGEDVIERLKDVFGDCVELDRGYLSFKIRLSKIDYRTIRAVWGFFRFWRENSHLLVAEDQKV